MLEQSQMLTNGLIIFSVLVSDYEKLDFKNDALAGVRANYFNSRHSVQKDNTELVFDKVKYNLSYYMSSDYALSWKVTKDNMPYQSVKRATGGVYCVIFYGENGVIYKRQYFDNKHNWIRTEYFDNFIANKLVCIIYPGIYRRVTVLNIEYINKDGTKTAKRLFPSRKNKNSKSTALIYSNVGMLWYDEKFAPEDLPHEDEIIYCGGFVFEQDFFDPSYLPKAPCDLASADYLEISDYEADEIEPTQHEEEAPTYSAYDKIGRILTEAHKSNKDLFGELVNQISDDDYNTAVKEVEEASEIPQSDNCNSIEQISTEENTLVDNISEEQLENGTEKDSEAETYLDNNSVTEATPTEKSENNINSKIESEEIAAEAEQAVTESNGITDECPKNAGDIFDLAENPPCDAVIITKSGRYAYYGQLDSNNCRIGRGRTVTPDGITSYDGEYNNDMRNGFGVCYYKDGNINYVGKWDSNNRHGCGVGYRLSDGAMHVGNWKNNSPDGFGARFDNAGVFIDVCKYENGTRNGKSISFDENGNIILSVYKNGEKISEKIIDIEE